MVNGILEQGESLKMQQCRASGGTWDAANKICISAEATKINKEAEKTKKAAEFSSFTPTEQTGTSSQNPLNLPEPTDPFATTPRTSEVLTEQITPPLVIDRNQLGPNDIVITDVEGNERIQTPQDVQREKAAFGGIGAAEALQQQQTQAVEQQRMQQIMSQLGQVGVLTSAQQAEINKSQAALAGGIGTIPGIATGVIGGALLGGKVGALAGAPGIALGVGLGAIGGFIAGFIGNVKKQQTGEIRAAELELTSARKIMRGMAEIARQDPSRAQEYKNIYNRQLTRVHQARRQLKAEVSGDLNSWMEDGRDNLARFDLFIAEEAPYYSQKLEIALLTGGEGIPFTDEQLDQMFGVTGEEI